MIHIGDIVKGIKDPIVGDLNDFCTMEVIEILNYDEILVTVLSHEYREDLVGVEFNVLPSEVLDVFTETYIKAPPLPAVSTSRLKSTDVNTAILVGIL
jgi:hypothetical protein|tara:strand:- start:18071 stop:18364 length:294 start_codon:yes stop_codon:yes gene_type:complete